MRDKENKMSEQVIPAEERIKTAHVSKHGLYPHEILALDYAPRIYADDTDPDSFQGFWWYQYGVKDVPAILASLLERGFLQVENLQRAMENTTVADIKKVLSDRGLKTGGKKAELMQRLTENVPHEELNAQFTRRKYQLTEHGQEALDAEEYVHFIHNQRSIEDLDIWSLNRLVYSEPKMSYRDKIWKYLNERSVKHSIEGQYSLYRNCRYSMASFLMQEGKLKNALGMLAEVAFYDFVAYQDYELPPGLIGDIAYCKEELEYSDEEFRTALLELINGLFVPKQKFTPTEGVNRIIKEAKDYIKNNPDQFVKEDDEEEAESLINNAQENDDAVIMSNPAEKAVLDALKQDLLAFLAERQPIPQKDFVAAWRESQPYSRIGDTKGVCIFLDDVFRSLVDEGKIRREKTGRAFTLFVNQGG